MGGGAVVLAGWLHRNPWSFTAAGRALRWVVAHRPGAATQRKLDALVAQLHSNGGSSLFDLATRLEQGQRSITEKLAILEAHVSAVRDTSGVMSFLADSNGEWLQCSRSLLSLMGMEQGEALGKGWKNGLAPTGAEAFIREWRSVVEDQRDLYGETLLRNVKNGTTQPVRLYVDVVFACGTLVGWVGRVELVQ